MFCLASVQGARSPGDIQYIQSNGFGHHCCLMSRQHLVRL